MAELTIAAVMRELRAVERRLETLELRHAQAPSEDAAVLQAAWTIFLRMFKGDPGFRARVIGQLAQLQTQGRRGPLTHYAASLVEGVS